MISFLQPVALLALVAAAGPALLHLLQRRVPPLVPFPAVQYLQDAAERHSRRLRLRNLLLLVLRTVILLLIVLAAARPAARVPLGVAHAPVAVALVVDHSLSSGAVVGGARVLDTLLARARRVVAAATTDDRLWLVLADAVPQRVTRMEAERLLASVTATAERMDLGEAVRAAARVVEADPLPGRVVVLSDNQATAWSPGVVTVPVLVWEFAGPAVNRGLVRVRAEPAVWTGRGHVIAEVGGSGDPVAVRLEVGDRVHARALAEPGAVAELEAQLAPGWHAARVLLDGDELRADDERWLAVRVMPPTPTVARPGAGAFVAAAVDVLQEGGRLVAGQGVTLDDRVGTGWHIVVPPADPARVGAVNRQLAARGVGWRFGPPAAGGPARSERLGLEATTVHRRFALEGDSAEVLATVGGAPWIVRRGGVVLVASRLEPEWTDLPASVVFLSFLDVLINQVTVVEVWVTETVPGAVVRVPEGNLRLVGAGGTLVVPGDGATVAPPDPGVWWAVRGVDTVGAVVVVPDPRESDLVPARPREVRAALGPDVRVTDRATPGDVYAASEGRADLTAWFVLLALGLLVVEFVVAARVGRSVEAA